MTIIIEVDENGKVTGALASGSCDVFISAPGKPLAKVDEELVTIEEMKREVISRGVA